MNNISEVNLDLINNAKFLCRASCLTSAANSYLVKQAFEKFFFLFSGPTAESLLGPGGGGRERAAETRPRKF